MSRTEKHPLVERYSALVADRAAAERALADVTARVSGAKELLEASEKVERFFHVLADERRNLLENRIESLVDNGLKYVFGNEYAFKVKSEVTGKQIKTKFYIREGGMELNILDAVGGGIGDVVSFLLRVVMLALKKPVQRRLLVLDEPFKFVSSGHFAKLTQLITELSETLDLQIIMVSHRPEIMECATTVIRVVKGADGSVAEIV